MATLVTFGSDPTVFLQEKDGTLVKAYKSWDQLTKEYPNAGKPGQIKQGRSVPKSQLAQGKGGEYGVKTKDGAYVGISNQDSFFKVTGTTDWGTINKIIPAANKPAQKAAAPAPKKAAPTVQNFHKYPGDPTVYDENQNPISLTWEQFQKKYPNAKIEDRNESDRIIDTLVSAIDLTGEFKTVDQAIDAGVKQLYDQGLGDLINEYYDTELSQFERDLETVKTRAEGDYQQAKSRAVENSDLAVSRIEEDRQRLMEQNALEYERTVRQVEPEYEHAGLAFSGTATQGLRELSQDNQRNQEAINQRAERQTTDTRSAAQQYLEDINKVRRRTVNDTNLQLERGRLDIGNARKQGQIAGQDYLSDYLKDVNKIDEANFYDNKSLVNDAFSSLNLG